MNAKYNFLPNIGWLTVTILIIAVIGCKQKAIVQDAPPEAVSSTEVILYSGTAKGNRVGG